MPFRGAGQRDPKKIALARKLYAAQEMTGQEICDMLHISRSTLYRYLHVTESS
jgi:DNA-binding transcriptional regulator LsrR (DeoR family)